MAKVSDLKSLLIDCVQDLYSNEQFTVGMLPVVIEAADDPALKQVLQEHREQSREHARRLEEIAGMLGKAAKGPDSMWAAGILGDAKRDTETVKSGRLLDAALIGAMRKLEAAETVSYETAIAVSHAVEMADAARLLARTHGEEEAMNARLLGRLEAVLGGVSATD